LRGRRNPFVAREGIPFLLLTAAAFAVALQYLNPWFAIAAACLFLILYLLFRDPHRRIPSAPLGVVSPVDGKVLLVDQIEHGLPGGRAHRIRIRIDSFGTYTARAPVEGKVRDLRHVPVDGNLRFERNALWLQTDEGDDVILQFSAYRFGLAPGALQGYGERVGQGERCANLRLTQMI
jgi:phosphatidylserine decarboxylase